MRSCHVPITGTPGALHRDLHVPHRTCDAMPKRGNPSMGTGWDALPPTGCLVPFQGCRMPECAPQTRAAGGGGGGAFCVRQAAGVRHSEMTATIQSPPGNDISHPEPTRRHPQGTLYQQFPFISQAEHHITPFPPPGQCGCPQ